MSSAVILQHVSWLGPGRVVPVFRDFGIPCDVRRLDHGDELPSDLDEVRVLVILGAPATMHLSEPADIEKHAFLAGEIALIQKLLKRDRPMLGLGFGARLLAHAAGAKVSANVKMGPPAGPGQPPKPVEPIEVLPEFGFAGVQFPFPGGTEPIVFGTSDGAPMFHWHTETLDLPRLPAPATPAPPPAPPPPTGNALLSSTHICKNQAFRFKQRSFGFQYHLELTKPLIEAFLENDRESLVAAKGDDAAIRESIAKHYPRYSRLGDRVLGNFVQFLKSYSPREVVAATNPLGKTASLAS